MIYFELSEILLVIFSIIKILLIIFPPIYIHYHLLTSKNLLIIFLDLLFISYGIFFICIIMYNINHIQACYRII